MKNKQNYFTGRTHNLRVDFFSRFYEIKASAYTLKLALSEIGRESEIKEEERDALHYTTTQLIERIEKLEQDIEEERERKEDNGEV